MDNDKASMYIIAIVAIIAIVGIIMMVTSGGNTGTGITTSEDTFGQAAKTSTTSGPNLQVTVTRNTAYPTPKAGDHYVYLKYTIKNVGNRAAAGMNVETNCYDTTGNMVAGWTMTSLNIAAGGIYTQDGVSVQDPIILQSPGNKTINCKVDYTNVIKESNENDNTNNVVIPVLPGSFVNLQLTATLDNTHPTPKAGDHYFYMKYTIKNVGNKIATGINMETNCYDIITGQQVSGLTISSFNLSANSSKTINGISVQDPIILQNSGDKTIRCQTDYTNVVVESNENDNHYNMIIPVQQGTMPNLKVVVTLDNTYPTPRQGDPYIYLKYAITNNGNAYAYGTDVETNCYDTTGQLVAGMFGNLNITTNSTIYDYGTSVEYPTILQTPGTKYLNCKVDYTNRIIESNENDNNNNLTIILLPNLQVSVSLDKTQPAPKVGDPYIYLNYEITNNGNAVANGIDVETNCYDTTGNMVAGWTMTNLNIPVGNTIYESGTSVAYPAILKTSGTKYINCKVDYTNVITESNEYDNNKNLTITVLNTYDVAR